MLAFPNKGTCLNQQSDARTHAVEVLMFPEKKRMFLKRRSHGLSLTSERRAVDGGGGANKERADLKDCVLSAVDFIRSKAETQHFLEIGQILSALYT